MAPCPGVCQDGAVAEHEPFAVVVVIRDHAQTLPACLAAVEALVPPPGRVVLVDNASTDGSAGIAASWSPSLPSEVLVEDENTGFAAAANRGIAACSEPWVLLLNPDCAPRSDFVQRLFEALARRPERARVAALTGRLSRASVPDLGFEATLDAAGMLVTCSGRHFDRGAGEADGGAFATSAWVFGGTGAATLYRREALADVAYPEDEVFASSFFAYREDAELAWRLQWRSWRCLYVPTARAAHARGFRPEAGRRGHDEINRLSVRNRFLLRLHCADLGWHLHCFPWWLLRDLVVVAACLTVEHSSLPALGDVWRLRSEARRRRAWVMRRRTASSRRVGRWFRRRGRVEEIEEG